MKKLALILGLTMSLSIYATPIFNIFELGIQSGKNTEYNAVGEQNINTSIQNENGTLAMYSLKQKDDSNMAYMVEIYADEEAYKTHINSSQYHAFLSASPQILTNHKKRIVLDPQFLSDKKVEQTKTTRTNLVIVEVKERNNQQFANIVINEMMQALKTEDGVLAMYAATQKDKPNKWFFFEIYASDMDYENHHQTQVFKEYIKQTVKMVTNKQMIQITPAYLLNKGGLNFLSPSYKK